MSHIQPIANIRCLTKACQELGVPYSYHDKNHNFIEIDIGRPYYFANGATPLNDEAVSKICHDKEFTHQLLQSTIRMPATAGFIDPECDPRYQHYVKQHSYPEIISEIKKEFSFPIIVKMNSGSFGVNVFRCENEDETLSAIKTIYNKASSHYDYIALAQKHVSIKREFRVIILDQKIILVYEKDFSGAHFTGNLSPFYQENSRAVLISDSKLIKKLQKFIMPLFTRLNVRFAGLDIVIDEKNDIYLLELNSRPGFEYFVRDNGEELLVPVYKKIITSLQHHAPHS